MSTSNIFDCNDSLSPMVINDQHETPMFLTLHTLFALNTFLTHFVLDSDCKTPSVLRLRQSAHDLFVHTNVRRYVVHYNYVSNFVYVFCRESVLSYTEQLIHIHNTVAHSVGLRACHKVAIVRPCCSLEPSEQTILGIR